jgi:hypothetical protein
MQQHGPSREAFQPPAPDTLIAGLLRQYPEYFDSITNHPARHAVQVIYTQIDRGKNGVPLFTDHYYNVDGSKYFYPASTVKLPVAALALQKLNELGIAGLNAKTTFITEAGFPGQTPVYNDPTTPDGRPTIEQYIKKILLVSDNDAYNRLYEFLGQDYINGSLQAMGYSTAQVIHRLSVPFTEEQNRHTNPITFLDRDRAVIYQQPMVRSNLTYQPRTTLLGRGYVSGNKLVETPFDFSKKNRLQLPDLHSIVRSIMFPLSVPEQQRFNLAPADYTLLRKYMSMYPGESGSPHYDSTYEEAYVKFLIGGGSGTIGDTAIRIFNKPGDAYGFLIDAAYVVDFDKGVEFLLSAVIYCNSDEVFNDDKYDYDTIGFPFMKNLGNVIYDYEVKRPRKNKPDLSAFKFDYHK